MAKSKQPSKPSPLSREKVYDSSDSGHNEDSETRPISSSKLKKLPLREADRRKSAENSPAANRLSPRAASDTTSEDEGQSTESEEDDEEDGSETESQGQEPSSESSKRKSPAETSEQPSRKKSKAAPVATSTIHIPPKAFQAPRGHEPLILSASDFASESASLFENLQGKQIWHISAPDTVNIGAIKELDIQAALSGQAILSKDGINYNMQPSFASNDVLLLPQGSDSTYEQSEMRISRSFHLRQMSSKPKLKHQTKDQAETPLTFTAVEEGKESIPRKQPGGLKMRYTPFGATPAARNDNDEDDIEMNTEIGTATFKVPDDVVGERSGGKQATNDDADSMHRGGKRDKRSQEKDRVTGSGEKKKKKKRRLVDEEGAL
ncbi:uncharacterized protein A1O9_00646 [Exophiala aquamarina CBS 119918]|uniref:DNA-directed RNA polymerase I subunit RPA34 n=1 Tax=Exophiala aquamarina CBS 119918 TaxID=1182545 RepID=A0A072PTK2_9EURO|nr:uncharacterized protein A1O9_00646 [Exophiala aquamarina CBS 119918]KEF62673.1 hypothetical protein A1O9_00646 [Exophiala aquamarina CBS 119918]